MVSLTLKYDASKVKRLSENSPVQIARVTRNLTNFIATDLRQSLGGSIPKKSGSNIAGFRRVRTRKTLSTVKRRRPFATLWLGGNTIAAKYGGRLYQTEKGAGAGKHFFKGSFIATMKTGYRSIFHRVNKQGKLAQDRFPVIELSAEAESTIMAKRTSWEKRLRVGIDDALNKAVKNAK